MPTWDGYENANVVALPSNTENQACMRGNCQDMNKANTYTNTYRCIPVILCDIPFL